jgi:hypothetical protein
MDCPAHGLLRLLRALAVAAVVLGLSAAAHVLGGGALPGAAELAALGTATTGFAWVLARWRSTPAGLLAVLTGAQLALHRALDALGPMPAPAHPMPMPMAPAHEPMAPAHEPMVLAHVAATVLLALLLARGEDALWALWAWWVPLAGLLLVAAPGPVPRPAVAVPSALPVGRRPVLLAADPRRGPPVACCG